jgi:hypothetical protein
MSSLPDNVTIKITIDPAAMERRLGRMWLANQPDDERNRREFPDLYGPLEDE